MTASETRSEPKPSEVEQWSQTAGARGLAARVT
jgi:hypothetical protein